MKIHLPQRTQSNAKEFLVIGFSFAPFASFAVKKVLK
jgi:hypothetical protein